MTSRYDNLSVAIEATINISKKTKPYRIVDIGVGSGLNADRMIRLAKKLGRSNIEYYGFDMFEDLNDLVSTQVAGHPCNIAFTDAALGKCQAQAALGGRAARQNHQA